MPLVAHKDVQFTTGLEPREMLREINSRLKHLEQIVNNNRRGSMVAQVSYTTSANATKKIWIASEVFDLESVTIVSTTAAGSVDLSISGVAVGGGTFALTTAEVNHTITSPNSTVNLDSVELITAALTGECCVTLNLRRTN